MSQGKVVTLKKPGDLSRDPLTELLRTGAQQLIAQAVEAELHAFLLQFSALTDEQGRQQVVRNGYLPERKVQTSIVRLGACINFSSFSSLPFSLAAWLWRLIPGKLACLVLDLEA